MTAAAAHFVLASWVLAGVLIAFSVTLLIAVFTSWRSTRTRPVGVIEAVMALRRARVIDEREGRDILNRYEGESA